MNSIKITAIFIIALVLSNLISWNQNADLLAKSRDVNPDFVQEGVASWYGPGFQGRKTANGERFNTYEMTAAHKTLPFNTLVKVTNLSNDMSIVVRINDRGPYIRGRIIDLSKAAKEEIQMGGLAQVRIEIYSEEEDQIEEEVEDNFSPVNLFEQEFPAQSKVFVEWNKETEPTEDAINQIFSSSKLKIKILTPNVQNANSKIYQEVTADSNFNYLDITQKVKFIAGYTIEVGSYSEKSFASDMIEKLESNNFTTIFMEEISNENSTAYKVYVGNYKVLPDTKSDLVKLLDMDYKLQTRIVKIGT